MKRRNRYESRTENRTRGPRIGRGIRLGVRVFLLVLLQVSVLPRFPFFGATPDLLLPYVLTLALTGRHPDRAKVTMVTAVAAGFLADTLGGSALGGLAVFYLLVGAVAASLFSNGFGGGIEEILRFLAVLVSAAVLREGWTFLLLLLDRPLGFAFLPCLTGTLLPEFFGTLLFAIPVFFIFRGRD